MKLLVYSDWSEKRWQEFQGIFRKFVEEGYLVDLVKIHDEVKPAMSVKSEKQGDGVFDLNGQCSSLNSDEDAEFSWYNLIRLSKYANILAEHDDVQEFKEFEKEQVKSHQDQE